MANPPTRVPAAPVQHVLLTGATGFVGRHVHPALWAEGYTVRCASRDPGEAARRFPGREWVHLEATDRASLRAALAGMDAVVWLVHGMAAGPGYEEREHTAAVLLREEADRAGLDRIVYLGGVAPQGALSPHLRSRLAVGATLREGSVPVVELRAAMIVGPGSASWRVCRDLAMRLPVMIVPRWLKSRLAPVAIGDVASALATALRIPLSGSLIADLPGPELLTGEEILRRIARLRGTNPVMVHVPFLTPRLSALWLRLVSDADHAVARELVAGLTHDLIPSEPSFWMWMPDHRPTFFDDAARAALAAEPLPVSRRLLEGLAHTLARRA